MRQYENLKGEVFGHLTVKQYAGADKWGASKWDCGCVCGTTVIVMARKLKSGQKRSCGCKQAKKSLFTPELQGEIREFYREHGSAKVAGIISEKYGVGLTKAQVQQQARRMGIRYRSKGDQRKRQNNGVISDTAKSAMQRRDEFNAILNTIPVASTGKRFDGRA